MEEKDPMKLIRLRLTLLILAFLSFLFLIAAQGVPDFGSLEEVMTWIISGGGAMILAGYIIAYLLENLTFWHNLPILIKKLAPFFFAGLIGFGARAILLGDLLAYVPPIVQSVILMLIAWIFSQIAYKGLKGTTYGASTREAASAKTPYTPQG